MSSATDRMSGAELQVWLDLLGLTRKAAAELLGVREDTVRKWCEGRDPVPYRVGDEIEAIDKDTAREIGLMVDRLKDARTPRIVVYRRDEDLWAEVPDLRPYGARWWRMVAARAALEVPDVEMAWK